MLQIPKLSLDQFTIIRTIGIGYFSHVDLCYHNVTENYCVLKVMSKQRIIEENQVEHVESEREILSMLNHPNIAIFYGSFQDHDSIYLMMEYVPGGEVYFHLRTLERFDVDVVRFYAAEILLVFQEMHSKGIIYRDLKPENLLFTQDGHIKFIDFGFAKRIEDRTYTLCGTPEFLAPEIIKGEGASFASDWWAFGVLIYEMMVGETPFYDDNENRMYQLICHGEISFPIGIDETTQDLIQSLLRVDPTQRLGCASEGAEEIKNHPWFYGIEWDKVYHHMYQPPLVPYVSDMADSSNYAPYTEQDVTPVPLTAPTTPDMFANF